MVCLKAQSKVMNKEIKSYNSTWNCMWDVLSALLNECTYTIETAK